MVDKEDLPASSVKPHPRIKMALQAGSQALASGDLHQAELKFREVLSLDEANPLANANLGLIAQKTGQHEQALAFFQLAMEAGLKNIALFLSLANSLNALGQWEQAEEFYKSSIELDPDSAKTYYNYGKNCQDIGDLPRAIDLYKKALAINPDIIECHCNMGLAYTELGLLDDAIKVLEVATSMRPEHIMSHYNLAIALLSRGDFKEGWQAYESRIEYPDGRVRQLPFKDWQGESLTGKHILVYTEQGVGDEVMFSSCLGGLIKEGAASVTLECDPRLAVLFGRSFPEISVVGNKKNQQTEWEKLFPATDLKVSLASLPRFYRNSIDDFPGTVPYLVPDKKKLQRWEKRLASLGDQPKVGIAWRGGAKEKTRQQRSTNLVDWAPVLKNNALFINLQYGECREEITQLEQQLGITIKDWEDTDPLLDLDDFYAQVSALDLVISVDNSTVHFAGAAGIPVWNLLAETPEFRWMLDRSDTPWYPSMRLFRRSKGGWDLLLAKVAGQLKQYLNARASQ